MATISELQRVLMQVAEQQQRLTRGLAIPPDLTRISQLVQTPHFGLAHSLAEVSRQHAAFAAATRSLSGIEDVVRQMNAAQAVIGDLAAPYRQVAELARQQSAVWSRLASPAFDALTPVRLGLPHLSNMALAWECGVAGVLQQIRESGLAPLRDGLASRLLQPSTVYTEFVQSTVDRLGATQDLAVQRALRGSLLLAENQLVGMADVLCDVVLAPEDQEAESESRPLTAPFFQQEELIAVGGIDDEEDQFLLVQKSPVAQTVGLAKEMLSLVARCNEASKTAGSAEIFKPTTRLLEVFADMPWLVASDKSRFADVVDCLYFVFYEGAGKDKLRFLKDQGGPLAPADCDLIWCIKHLRNKWTRHDADHGKESDIRRSWSELASKFSWLQLGSYPTELAHFRQMHDRLLREAIAFLRLILQKLTQP
ncbi:MAG: hypothetical protein U0840_28540 [Gemmataceae bacterium]